MYLKSYARECLASFKAIQFPVCGFLIDFLESQALESGIHLKESGIPLTLGIRNPSSTDKESAIQYFESGVHNPRQSGTALLVVSLAAVFWMSRNGALREIQKTAARETTLRGAICQKLKSGHREIVTSRRARDKVTSQCSSLINVVKICSSQLAFLQHQRPLVRRRTFHEPNLIH